MDDKEEKMRQLISEMISVGESTNVEFKEKPNEDTKKFLKTAVAFANGSGGSIIFGVNDNGNIVGLDGDYSTLSDTLTDLVSNEIYPQMYFSVRPCTIEGKHLLTLTVDHGSNTPYYYKREGPQEGVYIRINATTRKCSEELREDLTTQGRKISPDTVEIIGRTVNPDDSELKTLCSFATEESRKEIGVTQLCNMNLIKQRETEYVATIGYALLTYNPYLFARIECARFKGIDKSLFLYKKTCTGPIYQQIDGARDFVVGQLNTIVSMEGTHRKETLEIPINVIREIITNAVIHRCYSIESSPIFVAVHDDRIEIISPGTLPYGITPEEAIEGCRRHRNKALSEFFITTGYMEGWGSGLGNAFRTCLEEGLCEPVLEEFGENIRIIIWRKGAIPGDREVKQPLTIIQKEILEALNQNGNLRIPDLAAMLGYSNSSINIAIKNLKKSGRLVRSGSNKTGKWIVKSLI